MTSLAPKPTDPQKRAINSLETWNIWSRETIQYSKTNHAEAGGNLATQTPNTHTEAQRLPLPNDPRTHLVTGEDIPGTRQYPSRAAHEGENDLDDLQLPLTKEALQQFNIEYQRVTVTNDKAEVDRKRRAKDDTDLLNHMIQSLDANTNDRLQTSTDWPEFNAMTCTNLNRSNEFFKLASKQFSTGTAESSVQATMNIFKISQEQSGGSTQEVILELQRTWDIARATLEDPANRNYINTNKVQTIAIIHAVNKQLPANRAALEHFYSKYPTPGEALTHPEELKRTLLNYQQSDLYSIPVSEQSAAFAAQSSRNTKDDSQPAYLKFKFGEQRPGKTNHCVKCLAQSKQ